MDLSIFGKMKGLAVVLALAGAPGTVAAQGGPVPGCFERVYTPAHLAAHPEQVVAEIRLKVYDEGGERYAAMRVLFADQGHVRRDGFGGLEMDQYLVCFDGSGAPGCAVECDGGSFRVRKQDAGGITFRTDYLMVGDTEGCGGAADLAERVGQAVDYRLNRVEDMACAGM